jgi:hypothetical protein
MQAVDLLLAYLARPQGGAEGEAVDSLGPGVVRGLCAIMQRLTEVRRPVLRRVL